MGIEGLAAEELRELGCENVRAENGRVLFSGGAELLARANLGSRFGERVLLLLGEFPARSFEDLFQGTRALPWEALLDKEDAFPVSGEQPVEPAPQRAGLPGHHQKGHCGAAEGEVRASPGFRRPGPCTGCGSAF